MNRTLPQWLTKKVPSPHTVRQVEEMMRTARLHTVCESARCPNLGECWSHRTATFMILGDICTRNCGFCAIRVGRPSPPDPEEPARVAATAREMGLRHIVVTSVARDDLEDEGAGHFAATIREIRRASPQAIVEVLTPDFKAKPHLIRMVTDAGPDIYNHNIETVERLSPQVRPQARYRRTLKALATVKELAPNIYTKSGIMLGLGETRDEVIQTLRDLRAAGVQAVTIGQYLRPTTRHLPVQEYVPPEIFEEYERIGMDMGFLFVASAPFVRSSYNAIEFSRRILAERLAAS
ncbi:MAG: lipoyl synthase [Chthonomonadales bacterium]